MAGVWILAFFVVTPACWIQLILGTCSPGKFGESCLYSCHCGHSCNQTTGVCGEGCDSAWVGGHGANCQKENVAYRRNASSPTRLYMSSWSADKAVDGNRDRDVHHGSCFNAADATWGLWKVDLGRQYRIHDVKIYQPTHHPERIRSCVLYLSNTSSSTGLPCYAVPYDNPVNSNGVYSAVCDGIGRYFSITNSTKLNLCEVEIYVCSRGFFGETCNEFCHCAEEACDHLSGLCPGNCRPGWQGFKCDTECDANHYGVNCVNTCTDRKCSDVNSSCDRYTGSCDRRCLPGWRGVDCSQECDNGTYGQNCSMTCSERNCAGDSSCDHVRGKCDTGCVSGWKGEDCHEACHSQHYGPNCVKICASRHCVGNSSCNLTGNCDGGCRTGWTETDCTVCDSQHYGANCDKACASRHCIGSSSCNSTGDCDSGCESGWTLNDCTGKAEEARVLQAAYNAVHLAVAVAAAFVVGVVVGAVVCFVFWWRRNRRPQKTSESPPTNASDARNDQSQNSDDVGPETRIYDSLHAESPHDAKITGETYCTIKSGNTDSKAHAPTSRNLSESAGAQMYENIDNTSRKMDGAYSE
ncbi:multiple epidermal growth factor-like domains protein 10 isoform X1 [Haliotis rubra]|uniref:multiple epidermal growth factor-like domains protein 10 isoform X1 n=1 Tax=Haliotis rubra TaxID=36100 RepID=UPI001EE502E2|nr:multiple epidermal growth factor-like domains protein 10 isoform X1 [Haliotis rubra]